MARTTTEIKQALAADFISQPEVVNAYELDTAKNFDEQFSKASLESILLYDVAKSISELETLLDLHKREVTEIIETIIPHRPKWYRDMALKFMIDRVLIDETDKYDVEGMTEDEITAAQIVKYAVAVELNGLLVVKIATGSAGNLSPIASEQAVQFEAYMNEIRDAGVKLSIVNQAGDNFACELRIFFDPILLKSDVGTAVKNAIKTYITGLPFNGEYSNMSLVDAVQAVEGVKVVTFLSAASASNIEDKLTPVAGYFTYNEEQINLTLIPYAV